MQSKASWKRFRKPDGMNAQRVSKPVLVMGVLGSEVYFGPL